MIRQKKEMKNCGEKEKMPEGDELGLLNNRGKTFCSDKGKICAFILFKDESHGIILQRISPELCHDTYP